jgi:hypothetical protein
MKQRIFLLLLTALTMSTVTYSQATKKVTKCTAKSIPKPIISTPATKSSPNNSATIIRKWLCSVKQKRIFP